MMPETLEVLLRLEAGQRLLLAEQGKQTAEVRELAAEVRGLRGDLAGRKAPNTEPTPALRKEQADTLAATVPVLAATFGASRFASWQPLDIAKQQTAEAANLRLVLGPMTAQQLGKLLQLGLGHSFDGLRVVRAGKDGSARFWRCEAVNDPLTPLPRTSACADYRASPRKSTWAQSSAHCRVSRTSRDTSA